MPILPKILINAPARAALCLFSVLCGSPLLLPAQVANSAYRVLGQQDLRQNGVNMVLGGELYSPGNIAIDPRPGTPHLYISDSGNNRVLAWKDVTSFHNGDLPALYLGQLSAQNVNPLGIGTKGLITPVGLVVNPLTGDLYVADFNDHRVLRFPDPFSNPTRVEPDAVFGQPNFTTRTANSSGISRHTMALPRSLAFDSTGNLYVADSGNNRLLRFPAALLNTPNPDADLVIGQVDFASGFANSGKITNAAGFDNPAGLAFDAQGNLWVSDFRNARVLKFVPPFTLGMSASAVLGQADFTTGGVPPQRSASIIGGPNGLTCDSKGLLYVATPLDNRILIFDPTVSTAKDVLGQADFNSVAANASSYPRAAPDSLASPTDIKIGPDGSFVIADSGNNRVISTPSATKTATRVLGQQDFTSNGPNQIKPASINAAFKMVVDYSSAPFPLYVSDTNNHRVLIWRDMTTFQNGTPADLVIGQPDLYTALANVGGHGLTPTNNSLYSPRGLAVDAKGTLYVADSGNNRVLRFPRPVDQSGIILPDAVYGQTDFTTNTSTNVFGSSLYTPSGVAIGPTGNLFVADTGNNRVIEFPANGGTSTTAVRVYGQPTFSSGTAQTTRSSQSLSSPLGVYVDKTSNLYVADTGNHRVLIFSQTQNAPSTGASASIVIGQPGFNTGGANYGAAGLNVPLDVGLDSSGQIYVSDSGNNRVVVYPSQVFLPLSGAVATSAIGQQDINGTQPNYNTPDGLATPQGMYNPAGIFVDRRDTLYVGDAGNNRLVQYLLPTATVNAAHLLAGVAVAPSSLVTLFSAKLTGSTEAASTVPLPTSLAGISVTINDTIKSPMLYASAGQINFQMPSSAPLGNQRIAVRIAGTGELIAGGTVSLASISPGLYAVAVNQDGTINSPANPAARGSVIILYGNGQGAVSPSAQDGQPAPSSPLAHTLATPTSDGVTCVSQQSSVCVAVGSTFGDISYSGLAPNFIGLWQLNVKIPSNALTGNVPLRAVLDGAPSNLITIAIK